MQITIELPDSFLSYDKNTLGGEIRLSIALFYFKHRKISVGKASSIAGISIYQFLEECKKNEIPAFDLSEEDRQEELTNLRKALIWF